MTTTLVIGGIILLTIAFTIIAFNNIYKIVVGRKWKVKDENEEKWN